MHRYWPHPHLLMRAYAPNTYAAINGQVRFGPKCRRPKARRSRAATPPSPLSPNTRRGSISYTDASCQSVFTVLALLQRQWRGYAHKRAAVRVTRHFGTAADSTDSRQSVSDLIYKRINLYDRRPILESDS